MTNFIRPLIPIYIAEISLVFILWAVDNSSGINAVTYIQFTISLLLLPFFAGYVIGRTNHAALLRYCALAGASVSLATIAAVTLKFFIQTQPGEFFLSMAGFLIVSVVSAIPQALFGLLGGWVVRKNHASSI